MSGSLADLPDGDVEEFLKNKREEVARENERYERWEAGEDGTQDSDQADSREDERVAHVHALRGKYATTKISSYAFIDEKRRDVEREAAGEQGRA